MLKIQGKECENVFLVTKIYFCQLPIAQNHKLNKKEVFYEVSPNTYSSQPKALKLYLNTAQLLTNLNFSDLSWRTLNFFVSQIV